MRELLVLRHAKSRWDEPGVADHERALAPRGVEAATKMGRLIALRGWLPERVVCSTARRAVDTLDLAMATWLAADRPPVEHRADLYLAVPERLLAVVRAQPDTARRVLLVGHNPGLETFVPRLAGSGDRAARAALERKFPTGALARLGLEVASWQAADWMQAMLLDFVAPRDI